MAPVASAKIAVGELQPSQLEEAAVLCAAAFDDNPAYGELFSPGTPRGPALTWLFHGRLGVLRDAGGVVLCATSASTGELLGTLVALPPGCEPSLWLKLRWGLLMWPLRFGWDSLRRVLFVDSAAGKPKPSAPTESPPTDASPAAAAATPAASVVDACDEEVWELNNVAVAPAWQGQGVGSALLRAGLELIGPAAVRLNTQRANAQRLYERYGFVVRSSGLVGGPGTPVGSFLSTVMYRPAQQPQQN